MKTVFFSFLILAAGNVRSDSRQDVAVVDLTELNHFVDDEGREVFRQVIFYDWSASQKRFLVRAWRLVKSPEQLPRQSWRPSRYHTTWRDNGTTRRVRSKLFRETWTQHDPEKRNRRWLSEDRREPLWPVR